MSQTEPDVTSSQKFCKYTMYVLFIFFFRMASNFTTTTLTNGNLLNLIQSNDINFAVKSVLPSFESECSVESVKKV